MFISTYTSIYSHIVIAIRLGTHAHRHRQRDRGERGGERRGEENNTEDYNSSCYGKVFTDAWGATVADLMAALLHDVNEHSVTFYQTQAGAPL